jgi:hypothetical protein
LSGRVQRDARRAFLLDRIEKAIKLLRVSPKEIRLAAAPHKKLTGRYRRTISWRPDGTTTPLEKILASITSGHMAVDPNVPSRGIVAGKNDEPLAGQVLRSSGS